MIDARAALQARLGAELKRVRTRAGVRQGQLGLRQATVSEVERGLRLPSRAQADTWLSHADDEERRRVLALLDRAHLDVTGWEEVLDESGGAEHIAAAENESAVRVRGFHPLVLPAMLQVSGYADAVFRALGRPDVPSLVASRLQRQALLFEPGRRWQFLIAERVLDCAPAPAARSAQLRHLAAVADRVDLGIVPDGALIGTGGSFIIFTPSTGSGVGDDYVYLELVEGGARRYTPEKVAAYLQVWDELWKQAATGDAALDAITARERERSV